MTLKLYGEFTPVNKYEYHVPVLLRPSCPSLSRLSENSFHNEDDTTSIATIRHALRVHFPLFRLAIIPKMLGNNNVLYALVSLEECGGYCGLRAKIQSVVHFTPSELLHWMKHNYGQLLLGHESALTQMTEVELLYFQNRSQIKSEGTSDGLPF